MTLALRKTFAGLREATDDTGAAARGAVDEQAARAIERMARLSQRPPCVVMMGERNAGKTTAANHLIGGGLLPTSVLANTRFPTLVRHGAVPGIWSVAITGKRAPLNAPADLEGAPVALIEIALPYDRLQTMEILDVPASMPMGRIATLPGLPRLIVPVWCTPATQAWKESERQAWSRLEPRWRRRGVLAVTGLDRITEAEARERLARRLQAEAARQFATIAFTPAATQPRAALVPVLEALTRDLAARRTRAVSFLSQRLGRRVGEEVVRIEAAEIAMA